MSLTVDSNSIIPIIFPLSLLKGHTQQGIVSHLMYFDFLHQKVNVALLSSLHSVSFGRFFHSSHSENRTKCVLSWRCSRNMLRLRKVRQSRSSFLLFFMEKQKAASSRFLQAHLTSLLSEVLLTFFQQVLCSTLHTAERYVPIILKHLCASWMHVDFNQIKQTLCLNSFFQEYIFEAEKRTLTEAFSNLNGSEPGYLSFVNLSCLMIGLCSAKLHTVHGL